MSKATSTTTTAVPTTKPGLPLSSRRRLLAGSGLATIAVAFGLPAGVPPAQATPFVPTASNHHDAELLAACLAFEAEEATLYGLPDEAPDDVHRAALDRYHDAYAAVDDIQARTLAGLQAKARVVRSGLLMMDVDEDNEDATEWEIRGAWRLLKDVLALGAVA